MSSESCTTSSFETTVIFCGSFSRFSFLQLENVKRLSTFCRDRRPSSSTPEQVESGPAVQLPFSTIVVRVEAVTLAFEKIIHSNHQ